MTLVELAVSMFIVSIVLAGVSSVFIGVTRSSQRASVTTSTSADARIATEQITRELRVAVRPKGENSAIVSAAPDSVTFYALLNRTGAAATGTIVPTRIRYSYNGTCVQRVTTPGNEIVNPAATGPFYTWATGTETRCLLRTTAPLAFGYYDSGAVENSATPATAFPVPVGGLSLVTRQNVRSIEITVTAGSAENPHVPPAVVLARVTMSNVVNDTGGIT
jgi:type II secretory pathway pseudopilin PulG